MLRTNSKKVKEAIRAWVVAHYSPENYGYEETDDFKEAAQRIFDAYYEEYIKHSKRDVVCERSFVSWMQGLPSLLDTNFYYSCAVDIVGDILEQTEGERNKYDEMQAEALMAHLVAREIFAVCRH